MAVTFHTSRRVEFADTDMAGILHFSTYYRWMESVEHEFFRVNGAEVHGDDEGGMFGYARVKAEAEFARPVRYPQEISVILTVERVGRTSVSYGFVFSLEGETVATGTMSTVHIVKPRGADEIGSEPIPANVRGFLEG